jgi:hypothetical protein
VKKTYDVPCTPYQRLLRSPHLSRRAKQALRDQYQDLNPAELKRNIVRLQTRLLKLALRSQPLVTPSQKPKAAKAGHPWRRYSVTQVFR